MQYTKDDAVAIILRSIQPDDKDIPIIQAFFDSLLFFLEKRYGIVLFKTIKTSEYVVDRTSYRPVISANRQLKDAWNGIAEQEGEIEYTAGLEEVDDALLSVLIFATTHLYRKFRFEKEAINRISDVSGTVQFAPPDFEKWIPNYLTDYIHSIFEV